MSSLFYRKYWTIVGQDMVAAMLIVISSGHMHKKINYTHIALKKQQKISNYLPLSLCNAIYKGISKVLDNRLKIVLSCVILNTQSAFVPR